MKELSQAQLVVLCRCLSHKRLKKAQYKDKGLFNNSIKD